MSWLCILLKAKLCWFIYIYVYVCDGEIGFLSDGDNVDAFPLPSDDDVEDDDIPLNKETLHENQSRF